MTEPPKRLREDAQLALPRNVWRNRMPTDKSPAPSSLSKFPSDADRYAYNLFEMAKHKKPLTEMDWATILSASNVLREAAEAYKAQAEAAPKPAESEREKFQAILERERTAVANGVKAVKDALEHRDWLTEGRGPYEWDDDRWHSEFAAACKEILQALEPLEKIAADFSNCPTTQESIAKARATSSPELPRQYPLNVNGLKELADEWAKDDRLWTTQETVAFNLATFGRKVLSLVLTPSSGEDK